MASQPNGAVCLIPARGGSKRVPRKNTREFFGHPLLAYSIAAAKRSQLFSHILVSTDDAEIAEVAARYGADVIERPAEFATDSASLIDVAEHSLEALRARGVDAASLCQLMPNCPLRRAEDIVDHHRQFADGRRQFQISVVPFTGAYPQWALTAQPDGRGEWLFGDQYVVPSQNLTPPWCPTGAIWWVNVEAFLAQRRFYGSPFHLAPMDAIRGLDIDHERELDLADLLVRGLTDRDGTSPLERI